jgi:hypothetical protein
MKRGSMRHEKAQFDCSKVHRTENALKMRFACNMADKMHASRVETNLEAIQKNVHPSIPHENSNAHHLI